MPAQKYSVNQYLIEYLLASVKTDEIAVPEIQRPFVWDAIQVRDLLDSLYQGYPIGYIIVWKNPDVRLKDGSLSMGKKVVIDGQQRITALSASLLGRTVLTKEYETVHIRIGFNPKEERFEVTNPAIQRDKAWIPDIVPVMQGDVGLVRLIREYRQANSGVDEDYLERVFGQLTGITKKQIGMIELAADLDIETVTQIFIRINREGVTLSQADFAMSKIASNETYGGHDLRKAIDYFCHLAVAPEFYAHIEGNDQAFANTDYFRTMRWLRNETDDLYDPSYSDMLRVAYTAKFARGKLADLVALLSGRNFEAKTYEEEIAAKSFESLKHGVLDFMNETNFRRFLMIIKSAGYIDSSLIRSQAPLNFAYALYLKLRGEGYKSDDVERYTRRWFVLSFITSRYTASAETRFEEDIRAIDEQGFGEYLKRTEEAELSETFWNVGLVQALATSNSNHPAFNTFLASQARDNIRGFLSNSITVRSMLEHRGDMHHVFPRDYLKKKLGLRKSEYNQVANYVYTQQEINIAVGNQPPQSYMAAVRKQCKGGPLIYGAIADLDELERNLEENALPAMLIEDAVPEYEDFLSARRKLMAARLRDYYRSL
jgi:hypothetical protein